MMKILFLADLIFIGLFALSLANLLRLPTKPAFFSGVIILAYAAIILGAEILATLTVLNAYAFTILHGLLAAIGVGMWWYSGMPHFKMSIDFDKRKVLSFWREYPELLLLAISVLSVYLFNAFLILIVPPHNWDSMTYHLSRVGYWLQQNSFYPWETHNLRQTTFPINSEIGLLWTIIFWGTDHLVGYIQWFSVLLGVIVVFGTARFLGYSRSQSTFAALLWTTFPQIILQSTTTQNDVVSSSLFLAAIYYLFLGVHYRHYGALILSGVALGVALGTKLTVVMALPGLALGCLMLWYCQKGDGLKILIKWGVACAGGFVLLGAYTYGLNFLAYGALLGPPSYVEGISAESSQVNVFARTEVNMLRYLYQAADLTGLPEPLHEKLHTVKADVGKFGFEILGVDPQLPNTTRYELVFDFNDRTPTGEDSAWLGPLGFLLLLPIIIFFGITSLVRKDAYRFTLIAVAVLYSVVICASLFWSPWKGRRFVMVALVCAPFLAVYYRPGLIFTVVRWSIILVAITVMVNTTLFNEAKPLTGPRSIWALDKIERRTLPRSNTEPLVRLVKDEVPVDASIGLVLHPDDWDYPLFGQNFTRTLIPVDPPQRIFDEVWLEQQNFDYVIINLLEVEKIMDARLLPLLEEFTIVGDAFPWFLVRIGRSSEPTKWDLILKERISSGTTLDSAPITR